MDRLFALAQGEDISNELVTRVVGHSVQYSGPLPACDDFARYEQVLPGAADRIMAMAEEGLRQNGERIKNETIEKKAESHALQVVSSSHFVAVLGGFFIITMGLVYNVNWVAISGVLMALMTASPSFVAAWQRVKGTSDKEE